MAGLVYLTQTKWKYENAGTADLLSVSGVTVTADATKSKTGTAFYQTARTKCFDIPASSELWIKTDIYHTGSASSRFRIYNSAVGEGVCLQNNGYLNLFASGSQVLADINAFVNETLQTYIIYLKSGTTDGQIVLWVDGQLAAQYTGNISNGAVLDNFYFQSDDANTLFSSVIISNVKSEILPFEYRIKPEIFTSVKPSKGFIGFKPEVFVAFKNNSGTSTFKPEIFAVLDLSPTAEFTTADTKRIIGTSQTATGDTLKKCAIDEKSCADTSKIIVTSDSAFADTRRIVNYFEHIAADTLRALFIPAGIYLTPAVFSTLIIAPTLQQIFADTCRKISKIESANADTLRRIIERAIADTSRFITKTESASADSCRKISKIESANADTLTRHRVLETALADTLRDVDYPNWAVRDVAIADTLRRVIERAKADTCVFITNIERVIGDTVIRVPHILRYVIEDNPVTFRGVKSLRNASAYSLVNSFKDYGITLLNVTLNEMTLSDNFYLELTHPLDINDAVRGQLLDYPLDFLVEETSQRDLVQTVKGMYDGDKLLYTQIYTDKVLTSSTVETVSVDASWHPAHQSKYAFQETIYDGWTAKKYLEKIANYYGFNLNLLFDDFIYSRDLTESNITYRDLISQLFSWTSQLPQRQINVFIREGTLHCVQRGKEISTFDISDLPHSRPTINKKLIRSLWNNPDNVSGYSSSNDNSGSGGSGIDGVTYYNYPEFGDKNKDARDPIVSYAEDEEEYAVPFSGTIGYSDANTSVWIKYQCGLVHEDYSQLKNSTIESTRKQTYFYLSYGGEEYLSGKEGKIEISRTTEDGTREKVTQTVTVTNKYSSAGDGIYLLSEKEETTTTTKEHTSNNTLIDIDSETTIRETFHTPVGNGWYAQSVFVDGEAQGSNLSQGKPGNRISPYTINQVRKTMNKQNITPANQGDSSGSGSGSGSGGYDGGSGGRIESDGDWRNRLSSVDNTTFPVVGYELLQELTNALLWLNRKIQEEVSVDLIPKIENGIPSIDHVIDFTERVIFDGNEYFLVSNQISFTPRNFIQKLKLIRWYAQ